MGEMRSLHRRFSRPLRVPQYCTVEYSKIREFRSVLDKSFDPNFIRFTKSFRNTKR